MDPHDDLAQARALVTGLRKGLPSIPTADQLKAVGAGLLRFARTTAWQAWRTAAAGEELCHELVVLGDEGPALYLVSDGAGVAGPPHEHGTWAVITGIRGRELNRLFRIETLATRTVRCREEIAVGPGDVLILQSSDIHATTVLGTRSTFHLHLYGRPLHALPPSSARSYRESRG